MNKLELRLRYNEWTADGTKGTTVDLLVDGELIPDPGRDAVDLPFALLPSLTHDGDFFPVTCTCGDSGCNGIFEPTLISHEDGVVQWRMPKSGDFRRFTFDESQYREEILAIVSEGRRRVLAGQLQDAVPDCNQEFFNNSPLIRESMTLNESMRVEKGMWRRIGPGSQ